MAVPTRESYNRIQYLLSYSRSNIEGCRLVILRRRAAMVMVPMVKRVVDIVKDTRDETIYLVLELRVLSDALAPLLQAADFTAAMPDPDLKASPLGEETGALRLPHLAITTLSGRDFASLIGLDELRRGGRKVVVLTRAPKVQQLQRSATMAADAVLRWDAFASELFGSLQQLIRPGEKIGPGVVYEPAAASPGSAAVATEALPKPALSPRETEVLHRLVAGESNKMIARQLNVAEATVKAHLKALLRKLHVVNRTQAAIWAASRGLAGTAQEPAIEPSTTGRKSPNDAARARDKNVALTE
jgi:DNA-binding NarL/FixJ family response regulator